MPLQTMWFRGLGFLRSVGPPGNPGPCLALESELFHLRESHPSAVCVVCPVDTFASLPAPAHRNFSPSRLAAVSSRIAWTYAFKL
jgi:hypothetical protein